MEYIFVERAEKQQGHNWFGHQVKLHLPKDRREELHHYLESSFGPKGPSWRISHPAYYSTWHQNFSTVKFKDKAHAALFKLGWAEDEWVDPDIAWRLKMFSSAPNYVSQQGGIGAYTSGIYPTMSGAGKTHSLASQALNRASQRYKGSEDVIIMDYESDPIPWYRHHRANGICSTWAQYVAQLDAIEGEHTYDYVRKMIEALGPDFKAQANAAYGEVITTSAPLSPRLEILKSRCSGEERTGDAPLASS